MIERLGDRRTDLLVGQQRVPVEQQVIEIEHPERALANTVRAEDRRERLPVLLTPGEPLRQDFSQGPLGVDGPGVDVEHRAGTWKAPAALSLTLFLADQVQQVRSVTGIEHTEATVETEGDRMRADHAMGDRMKGPADDPTRVRSHTLGECPCALDHLAGGASGEREQQHPFRGHPFRHQPRCSAAQRRRLSGPGAGEDQQRVAGVRGGGPLVNIQLIEEGR